MTFSSANHVAKSMNSSHKETSIQSLCKQKQEIAWENCLHKVIPWNLVWLTNHQVSYGNLATAKKHDISKAMYVCSYKTPNLKRTSYKNTGGKESRKHQKGNLIGKTVLQKPFEISVGSLTRPLCSTQQQNRTRKPRRGVHKNDISQDNLSTAFNNMKLHNEVHLMRKSYPKSMQQKQHNISWGKSITISLGGSNKASNVMRKSHDISSGPKSMISH